METIKNKRDFRWNKEYFEPIKDQILEEKTNWCTSISAVIKKDKKGNKKKIIRITRWRTKKENKHTYWKPKSGFNINYQTEWNLINSLIPSIFKKVGWKLIKQTRYISEDRFNELLEQKSKVEEDLEQLKSRLAEKELKLRKKSLKVYKKSLDELRRLINTKRKSETQIHKFLRKKKNKWMFGLEYNDIKHKVWFPEGTNQNQFDTLLKRYDGFYDILELESSAFEKLLTKKKNPIAALKDAINQVITYLDVCLSAGQMTEIYKPRGIIIIGRSSSNESKVIRSWSHYLNNIEIITYDDLIKKAESIIDFIKKSR